MQPICFFLNNNPVDSTTQKCDSVSVRIFRQSIVAIFFLAFFAVSGTNGLCGIFSITGLSHHHDSVAEDSKVCFGEEEHCEDTHVPCNEVKEDFLKGKLTVPSVSAVSVASQVVDTMTVQVAEFGYLMGISEPGFRVRCELIRGSPVNRHIVLCRFLV